MSAARTVASDASDRLEHHTRVRRARQARGRQAGLVWLNDLLLRAEHWRMPLPLERALGAEAPPWVALLLIVPIVAIGLTLTVGLWIDGLPRVDNDYWWHLATGDWILDQGRVPTTDPFSWTRGGGDWVAHEWLAAVMFALADRIAGYAGPITLVAVVAVVGMWRLAAGMRMYGLSRRAICILALLWGGVFLRGGVMVLRPQVLTFALMAVLLAELAAYETGRRRHLWVLPPLFVLWVNINLTVLIGGLCLGAFAIDRLLKGKLDRHLFIISALSGLALLVNPQGPLLLLTALKYRDSDALRYQYIFEWMGPRFSDLTHIPFWLALPAVPLAAIQLLRLRIWPALPVLVLAYQSFTAIRFIPIYVILALIFAAWLVWRMALDRREQPMPSPPLFPRKLCTPAVAILATLVVLIVAVRSDASQFREEPVAWSFPARATSILMEEYPDARLFNVYDYGGYLIHRFDGQNRVYVDGREEMYGEPFLRHYFSLIYGEPGWEETFNEEGIDAVLIRRNDGLSDEIEGSPGWERIYRDSYSALYVRSPNEEASDLAGG